MTNDELAVTLRQRPTFLLVLQFLSLSLLFQQISDHHGIRDVHSLQYVASITSTRANQRGRLIPHIFSSQASQLTVWAKFQRQYSSSSISAMSLQEISTDQSSAATQWMENEKRLEDKIGTIEIATDAILSQTNNEKYNFKESQAHSVGRWEYLHGNYILRPPTSSTNEVPTPRALLHFLGGAFLGAAPQLTYRYLLERLARSGYLIVATPYQLSFDHLKSCDEIIDKFERVAPSLAKQYGPVPVVGVGHSCGALLHMLITSLFPDTPRAANALISYNNRGVSDAIPLFDEVVVPLFSDKERNGSELMKALIQVTREKFYGEVPSEESIVQLLKSLPLPIPGIDSLLTPALVSIPTPFRQIFTTFLSEPTFQALTNAGLANILLQSLDMTQQIPKLIDEVEAGARDFVPTPDAMSSAARRAYRCRRTLLLQFENDNLDDSPQLEEYLKEAETVMRMKRPMITIDMKRKVLEGNHLTPLIGPVGGEEWGTRLEETLGAILTLDPKASKDVDTSNAVDALAARNRLGYDQLERLVEELVSWLEEGSL